MNAHALTYTLINGLPWLVRGIDGQPGLRSVSMYKNVFACYVSTQKSKINEEPKYCITWGVNLLTVEEEMDPSCDCAGAANPLLSVLYYSARS